jgi:hypothetical protein
MFPIYFVFLPQIAAEREELFTLRAMGLSSGRIPLPRVILHWEARGSHPVKVYDVGEREIDRSNIFVKPENICQENL